MNDAEKRARLEVWKSLQEQQLPVVHGQVEAFSGCAQYACPGCESEPIQAGPRAFAYMDPLITVCAVCHTRFKMVRPPEWQVLDYRRD